MNKLKVKDLELVLPNVTILTYDLDTTENQCINNFIKQTLLTDGWKDEIENVIVRQLSYRDVLQKGELPFSPLYGKGNALLHKPSMSLRQRCWLITQNMKVLVLMEKPCFFCGNKYPAIDKRKL